MFVPMPWSEVKNRLQQLHPTLDFSECQPCGGKEKLKVLCPEHGAFHKAPVKMINAPYQGCPKCSRARKGLTHRVPVSEARTRIKERFGNRITINKDTDYTSANTISTFTCRHHGPFKSRLYSILMTKYGCKECAKAGRSRSEEKFKKLLNDLRGLHTNRSYEVAATRNTPPHEQQTLTCSRHGIFVTTIAQLKQGKGCPRCGLETRAKNKLKNTGNRLISRLRAIYGDQYDYSKVVYTGQYKPIILICKDHGMFEKPPVSLLFGNRSGCPFCSNRWVCRDDVQRRVDARHGKGQYTCGEVLDSLTPFKVTCSTCSGTWTAKNVADVVNGYGRCLVCYPPEAAGFDKNLPATLYNIAFYLTSNEIVYKIGVTNSTVEYRIERMGISKDVDFRILSSIRYNRGLTAYKQEQLLLKKFAAFRYRGEPFLASGWTEVFTVNPFTHNTTP